MSDDAQTQIVEGTSRRHERVRHRPQDARAVRAEIAKAKTVIWNGPMGVFEKKPFAGRHRGVAEAVRGGTSERRHDDHRRRRQRRGDRADGLSESVSHVSTGGRGIARVPWRTPILDSLDILD
jgi:3-phosphoglycerate kinase